VRAGGLGSKFVIDLKRKFSLKQSVLGYEYVPARWVEGPTRSYIEFQVWDVQADKLVRRRVGLGRKRSPEDIRQEAKVKVREINAMLESGMVIDRRKKGDAELAVPKTLAVSKAFTNMVAVKSATGGNRTQQAYRNFLNVFRGWAEQEQLWSMPLTGFKRRHVHDFLDYLLSVRKINNKSHNNYLALLKALFNAMVSREMIPKSPAAGIKKLKTVAQTHTVYTPDQQALMESWMQVHMPRLFLFTRMVYFAFLRPAELMRLKVGQIDLENRVIMVTAEQSKNSKQEGVFIVDPLYELLKAERLDRLDPGHYLFSRNLEPGHIHWVRNRVSELHRQALEETGLYDGKLTLYSWKHTGVCNAYRHGGVDIKTLQALLRHHSLDMTAIYLRAMGLQLNDNLKGKSW